jgi:dethiobiotin synthetase
MRLPERFFVTGTDTSVGKTFVSAILMLGLKAKYWKPIQTGTKDGTDTEWLQLVTGLPQEQFYPERYRMAEPLSPHAAAQIEGIEIELSQLSLPGPKTAPLIVEGAGGVLVPVNDRDFMLDVMKTLALPVVLVARSGLGTINHTLLTLERLRASGLEIVGVVMNGKANPSNRKALEQYGKIEVIAEIQPIPMVSRPELMQVFDEKFGVPA